MKISVVRSETTTSSWSLSRSQWGEARLHPHANSLHHLLQHDASMSHRRSQRRWWHLHTVPHWWQPIQLAAPTGPHQDPSRVSRMGATFCRWCHLCSPYTKCPAAHNILLHIGIPNSLVLKSAFKKTEVLHQPTPKETFCPPHITIDETELKAVQQFTYLRCTISDKGKQCFWQALQLYLEQQALEESHKKQHLQSRGTAYPPVWLRDVGHIQ